MPDVMITNVPPTAAMPTTDTCTMMLVSVLVVRNSGEANESAMQMIASAAHSGPRPLRSCCRSFLIKRLDRRCSSVSLAAVEFMRLLLSSPIG
jgi:hypothetical protein